MMTLTKKTGKMASKGRSMAARTCTLTDSMVFGVHLTTSSVLEPPRQCICGPICFVCWKVLLLLLLSPPPLLLLLPLLRCFCCRCCVAAAAAVAPVVLWVVWASVHEQLPTPTSTPMSANPTRRPAPQSAQTLVSRLTEAVVDELPRVFIDTAAAVGRSILGARGRAAAVPSSAAGASAAANSAGASSTDTDTGSGSGSGSSSITTTTSNTSNNNSSSTTPPTGSSAATVSSGAGHVRRAENITRSSPRKNTLIKVHFLGWHMKWNQWIDLRQHPQRIQPRNSMVVAWRKYLRPGSPVEACINKERLGELPPGTTEIVNPPPEIFEAGERGRWFWFESVGRFLTSYACAARECMRECASVCVSGGGCLCLAAASVCV
jgi:hypothetical protein